MLEWAEVPQAGHWLKEAGGSPGPGYRCTGESTYDRSRDWESSPPSYMYPPPKWQHPCCLMKRKDKVKDKKKREKQCKMSSKKCIEYGEQKNNKKEPETGEHKMRARDLI